MSSAAVPWPPALAGTPAVAVIEKAIGRKRLSHSLLLAGDDSECLSATALALADRLLRLDSPKAASLPPERHPDCLQLRPAGKSRSIRVEAVRELIATVNVSSSLSSHKVVILHDADRMNVQASNILLKTLEEPPANTTLLLLTTRPHMLLPTIRSRMLHFRFPGLASAVPVEGWDGWITDYRAWLSRIAQGVAPGRGTAESLMSVYGLIARFGYLLDKAVAGEWTRRKATLPEDLEEEEVTAIEAEISAGLKFRMFAAIEEATNAHYRAQLASGEAPSTRPLASATESLERAAGLLRLNVNESTALEDFLLASLRTWAKR